MISLIVGSLIPRFSNTKDFSTQNLTKNEGTNASSNENIFVPSPWEKIGHATDPETEEMVKSGVKVYENFVTEEEEGSLMAEIEPQFKRLRYENSHWDDVS